MVDNIEKNIEKIVDVSGICTNCKNDKTCDFIKDIKVFIANKNCAKKVSDMELTVYSCESYEVEKDICSECGICLSRKQEV